MVPLVQQDFLLFRRNFSPVKMQCEPVVLLEFFFSASVWEKRVSKSPLISHLTPPTQVWVSLLMCGHIVCPNSPRAFSAIEGKTEGMRNTVCWFTHAVCCNSFLNSLLCWLSRLEFLIQWSAKQKENSSASIKEAKQDLQPAMVGWVGWWTGVLLHQSKTCRSTTPDIGLWRHSPHCCSESLTLRRTHSSKDVSYQ